MEDAAGQLANIDDSPPSTGTRQQCLLALRSGANTDSDVLQTSANTDWDADIVDDAPEDTPTRRRHQRRVQLAIATTRACTATNNYMRRLFAAADTGNDNDSDGDYNPVDDEPAPAVVPADVPVAASRQQVQYGTNRLTNVGRDWLLEKCVKEDLFPKIKFAKLSGNLDFSNNPMSICRFMAQKMKVSDADVESWWETSKETVHAKLKVNRNNVIKAIKTRFQGKKEMSPDSAMMLNCTHMTVFASTADNILKETQREFHLPSIRGMRRIASRAAYIELLDCLARAVMDGKYTSRTG